MHLFTFSGIKPKERWAVESLEDASRRLSPSELRTVSLVDYTRESAQRRAEGDGWMRLNLVESRALSDEEFALAGFNSLLDDSRFGALWAYFAHVLEQATFERKPRSELQISFVTRASHYSLRSTPQLGIHTQDDGNGVLTIRGPALEEKVDLLPDDLAQWWSVPMKPRQTAISRKLTAPWSVTDAVRLGLETLILLFPISDRDFMTVRGSSITKGQYLDSLRTVIHGATRFYHLHVRESPNWLEDAALLRATTPPAPKLDRHLSAEDRERFVSVWKRRIPGVHDWSDDEILLGMFHGM